MEDQDKHHSNEGSVSDALFGTSSDAIIEGLHQGVLQVQELNDGAVTTDAPGKDQIVNEQDQDDVTNQSDGDEYAAAPQQVSSTSPSGSLLMSKNEAEGLLTDNHLDETGDSETTVSPRNLEEDKIN